MAAIHAVKIIPHTYEEACFLGLMDKVGVKRKALMCRRSTDFNTVYDEYVISNGLYKEIEYDLAKILKKKGA